MPVYRGIEAEAGRASAAWDHARRAMGRVVLFLFLRFSSFPGFLSFRVFAWCLVPVCTGWTWGPVDVRILGRASTESSVGGKYRPRHRLGMRPGPGGWDGACEQCTPPKKTVTVKPYVPVTVRT